MACFNEVQYIRRAIESILQQSFYEFEFIIVDDASTDATYSICESYAKKDDRVRLFRRKEHFGFCAAPLNEAISYARADMVARMDADDYSHPQRLQRQYDFLQQHPEVDILGTAVRLIAKKDGQVIGDYFYKEKHEDILKDRYYKTMFSHPTVMLRKKVYEQLNGYDEQVGRSEDIDFWLRAYPHFRFHNLQEVLLDFSVRSEKKLYSEYRTFKNNIDVKWRAMKRNGEVWKNAPALVRQYLLFFYYRFLRGNR